MQMIDVLKRLAELDEASPPQPQVQMANDPALTVITEGVMMPAPEGTPAPAPQVPASFSLNASASSGSEVADMLTQIMNLAGVKTVGDKDINQPEKPMTAEPMHSDIKSALQAVDGIEDEEAAMGAEITGGEPPMTTDMDGEHGAAATLAGGSNGDIGDMADQVRDMANELGATDKEELGLESLRQFDNSPEEHTRSFNPNDFANIINKVRGFDQVPARGGDNPLPESVEQYQPAEQQGNLFDATAKLYQEYQSFIKNI
jgi:hypothetical protein